MSSSTTGDSLSKAYRLIEADELGAARAVLEPLVEAEPDNADAWWLYAHAVTDTFAARRALDQVVRLNPNYPGAAELLNQLEVVSRTESETEPLPVGEIETVDFEPELVFDDEEPVVDTVVDEEPVIAPVASTTDEVEHVEAAKPRSSRSWLPFVALLAVVLIAAVLLLQGQGTGEGDTVAVVPSPAPEVGLAMVETEAATGDEEADVVVPEVETDEPVIDTEPEEPTTEAAEEPTAETPVEEPTTEAAGEDVGDETVVEPIGDAVVDAASAPNTQVAMLPPGADFTPLVDALEDYAVSADDVAEAETDLGNTVVVTVCAPAGTSIRQSLPAVMDIIAARAAVVAANADAVGARIVNCETDRSLTYIAVPKDQAVEYAVGNLSIEEFQATWRPQ